MYMYMMYVINNDKVVPLQWPLSKEANLPILWSKYVCIITNMTKLLNDLYIHTLSLLPR